MQAPDQEEFIKAMKKELQDHIECKQWTIVPLKSIPPHKQACYTHGHVCLAQKLAQHGINRFSLHFHKPK